MAKRLHPDPNLPVCRRVLILAAAPAQLLDIAGPAEVFAQAGRLHAIERDSGTGASTSLYHIDCLIVPEPGLPSTTSGLDLASTTTGTALLEGPALDTLVVVGGEGARTRGDGDAIQHLVRHLAPRARRVVGVCTGAFVLAAAGLLEGRRVTTHWRWCAELARRYPGLIVEPDPIYLRDGAVWTSAGISAGMDLALALVEQDQGHTLALAVARELVLFLRRPGDQKQFSTVLSAQTGPTARLGTLLPWMAENLQRPLPVEALAARAGMSARTFARVFLDETGLTPARLVERMRVEEARRRLENGRTGLTAVAAACGFQTEETMRRSFLRQVGTAPGDYRDRFQRGPDTPHASNTPNAPNTQETSP
jgi:transcriptional regulator GlxA family with amidase domain